mmetsp:Transcript_103194/g.277235  ORF Transcript_103194/g.277235 Transcript_103194/m.277235 type:complete len:239 (-) Transcript_103194:99-815(-)
MMPRRVANDLHRSSRASHTSFAQHLSSPSCPLGFRAWSSSSSTRHSSQVVASGRRSTGSHARHHRRPHRRGCRQAHSRGHARRPPTHSAITSITLSKNSVCFSSCLLSRLRDNVTARSGSQPAVLRNACAALQAPSRHSQTLQAALAAAGTSRCICESPTSSTSLLPLIAAHFPDLRVHNAPIHVEQLTAKLVEPSMTTHLGVLLDLLSLLNCCRSLLRWASLSQRLSRATCAFLRVV